MNKIIKPKPNIDEYVKCRYCGQKFSPKGLSNHQKNCKKNPEVIKKQEEKRPNKINVYTRGGEFVRAYSKEVHGEDFEKLAKSFAAKKNYKLS